MTTGYIGRVPHGDTTVRDYILSLPNVHMTDRAFVPATQRTIYLGNVKRLTPRSRELIGKLEEALDGMQGVGICYIDLHPKAWLKLSPHLRILTIKLAHALGFTDNEARWKQVEASLTRSFGLAMQDIPPVARQPNVTRLDLRKRQRRVA